MILVVVLVALVIILLVITMPVMLVTVARAMREGSLEAIHPRCEVWNAGMYKQSRQKVITATRRRTAADEDLRTGGERWEELRRAGKSWDELRRAARSWDQLRWAQMSWEARRGAEKSWEERRRAQKSCQLVNFLPRTKTSFSQLHVAVFEGSLERKLTSQHALFEGSLTRQLRFHNFTTCAK